MVQNAGITRRSFTCITLNTNKGLYNCICHAVLQDHKTQMCFNQLRAFYNNLLLTNGFYRLARSGVVI